MNPMTQPEAQSQTSGKWSRLAWLPIPLLLAAIIAARIADLRDSYESQTLLLVLSFTFYTLVSLGTLYLVGRSFLAIGSPGLLLLECGVVLWSLAGTVGDFVSHGDANINVTIFNTCILVAGLCHLAGAILTMKPQIAFRAKSLWLVASCVFALGVLWFVTYASLSGWIPVFFIPDRGGTTVRYFVLISAVAMFVLSAGVLLARQRTTRLPFTSWYALALLLLAVGLFGVMIQLSLGSVVNWLSRTAQWLGGIYLFIAALASLRESQLPLLPPENKLQPAYYRDAVAVAVVLAAAAIRLTFLSSIGTQAPYLVFFPAVTFAALYGGLRSGILATTLSAILAYYFWIAPGNQFTIGQPSVWLALVIFLVSGAMIAWVAEVMHRSRIRAAAAEAQVLLAAEREAAAEALRQSEERHRTLFETMTEGFALHEIITDDKGQPCDYRFLEVNPAFERLTGLKREHLLGRRVREMIPGIESHWIDTYGKVAITGEPAHIENFSAELKRWYDVFAYRPAPCRFAVIFSDITGRKQAEKERDWVFKYSIDMLCVVGFDGYFKRVSPSFVNILGWSESELLSKPMFVFIHPDDCEETRLTAKSHEEGKQAVRFENRYQCKDGSYRWVSWNSHPIVEEKLVIGVARDITEQKLMEDAVRRHNATLEGINKVLEAALTSKTEEDLGVVCLEIAEKLTQSKSGFIGEINEKGLSDIAISNPGWDACSIIDAGGHRRLPNNFKIHGVYGRVLSEGKALFTNDPAHHPDQIGLPAGHPSLDAFLGVPLIHESHVLGMIALANRPGGYTPAEQETLERLAPAIVEAFMRKRTEAEVLKLSEVMAARNLELEAANREMESFIYSVSHDLRAPIRTMAGFAEFLMEDYADKLDEEGKNYLSRIHAGSEKMTRLIEELLKLSQINRQRIDCVETDLSSKVSTLLAEFREAGPDRNVEVTIHPDLKASADPMLIELVLSNILGNAWKFTSKMEKARIEFGSTEKEGKIVYFVKDNGAGFDPTYAEKMFQPFHRLHTEKEFEGTGIGLAIVERIIHRHGGKVWAEGKVDKGATIYFTLG
jgi:PAS domain S-box-containing protein